MKVEIVNDEKDMKTVDIATDTSFVNLVHEKIWEAKGFSAYARKHPYLENPKIMLKGKPSKILADAADRIISDVKEIRKQVNRVK